LITSYPRVAGIADFVVA